MTVYGTFVIPTAVNGKMDTEKNISTLYNLVYYYFLYIHQ